MQFYLANLVFLLRLIVTPTIHMWLHSTPNSCICICVVLCNKREKERMNIRTNTNF